MPVVDPGRTDARRGVAAAVPAPGTRVFLLAPRDIDDDFLDRWSRLADGALEPNPFLDPALLGAAAEHLTDDPTLRLLVAERDGELCFLAPVHLTPRFRRVPVRTLRTWAHEHAYLGTPLLSPRAPETTWYAVLAHLRKGRPGTWFCLEQVRGDGPVVGAFRQACSALGTTPSVLARSQRASLERDVTAAYVAERLSASRRKALRRQHRRLSEAVGSPLVVDDVADGCSDQLRAALDHFLDLEAAGWKGVDGGAMRCTEGHAEFFHALCTGFAARGRLELLRLGATGTTVAYACTLRSQGGEFGFKIAYDPAFSRFSPGTLLDLAKLDALAAGSERARFDSCASPDNEVSNRLFADRIDLATLAVPLRPWRGRLACALVPRLLRAHARRRAVPAPIEEGSPS